LPKHVGIAGEEEFRLEFHWLAEFDSLQYAGANEVAFGPGDHGIGNDPMTAM